MGFEQQYDFSLVVNEAEKLVINELEKQLKDEPDETCLCSECVLDMTSCALNNVKPFYRFSLMGALYASFAIHDKEYAESIKTAVADAIERIKSNPGHTL
ncbi:MAG: late competence development ComFB family protein [Spirochaetes bacterium]|nr:late competence development ComFB family protein [Spirochaetota bacterium]